MAQNDQYSLREALPLKQAYFLNVFHAITEHS